MLWQPLVSWPILVSVAVLAVGLLVLGFLRAPKVLLQQRRWRLVRRSLLTVVLVVSLAGPSIPVGTQETNTNVEIYLVVDRTGSMVAEDYDGKQPRLEGVKSAISEILNTTAGSRYSVITWDSSARLELPVTTDSSAVASFVDTLHQEITQYSTGSSMNEPVELLIEQLETAASERPQNMRYVLVFTDGESTLDSEEESTVSTLWDKVGDLIDGGAVFGYGTSEGGRMQSYTRGVGATGEYITDPTQVGEVEALSYIDEEALEQIANYLGVDLLINASSDQASAVGEDLMVDAQNVPEERREVITWRYIIWPFAAVAALLSAWEALDLGRRLAGLRRTRVI